MYKKSVIEKQTFLIDFQLVCCWKMCKHHVKKVNLAPNLQLSTFLPKTELLELINQIRKIRPQNHLKIK